MKMESSAGEHEVAHLIGADKEFASTFGIEFLSGRNFESIADSSSVILNETAAKLLNIQELSDQTVVIPERAFNGSFFPVAGGKPFKARVIGIIKDFHYQSLREKIGPLVLAHAKNPVQPIDYFTARIDAGDPSVVIKKIGETMAGIDQENFFEYHLLDEQLALFYIEDKRRETLLIWVAIAAIVIACLGLFGLATYTAEQRIKEIGIRKVLGANTTQLVSLLSKGFLKLVLIANIIALPVAWWAGSQWLQEFAYHIDLSWWVFVLACLAAILIALLTVSFQAVRAAVANPVKNLRIE
jgi:putative ABC transport system permease protein